MTDNRIHAARRKGALPMGGAINRSFISAHFLLSTYFLTVQTYKCMRLITRAYSMTAHPKLSIGKGQSHQLQSTEHSQCTWLDYSMRLHIMHTVHAGYVL